LNPQTNLDPIVERISEELQFFLFVAASRQSAAVH
jgi:hypothetical protein